MGFPPASRRPTSPRATNERGATPQREQRPALDVALPFAEVPLTTWITPPRNARLQLEAADLAYDHGRRRRVRRRSVRGRRPAAFVDVVLVTDAGSRVRCALASGDVLHRVRHVPAMVMLPHGPVEVDAHAVDPPDRVGSRQLVAHGEVVLFPIRRHHPCAHAGAASAGIMIMVPVSTNSIVFRVSLLLVRWRPFPKRVSAGRFRNAFLPGRFRNAFLPAVSETRFCPAVSETRFCPAVSETRFCRAGPGAPPGRWSRAGSIDCYSSGAPGFGCSVGSCSTIEPVRFPLQQLTHRVRDPRSLHFTARPNAGAYRVQGQGGADRVITRSLGP